MAYGNQKVLKTSNSHVYNDTKSDQYTEKRVADIFSNIIQGVLGKILQILPTQTLLKDPVAKT